MLVELFLLRLEIAMRLAEEVNSPPAPRFVPLPHGMKPKFKIKLAAV